MATYSKDALLKELERVRKEKRNIVAPDHTSVMPETLGTKMFDQTLRFKNLQNIGEFGSNETALINEKVQNQQELDELKRRQQEAARARQMLAQARRQEPAYRGPNVKGGNINISGSIDGGNVYGNYQGQRDFAPRWGKDNTPEVSDLKRINPNAKLVSVNFRGRHFVVNSQVKDIFVALLDDLWARGYRPGIIGGYNDRNIAGTNTKSLHAYGLAIDIDPARNPVQYGSNRHALPRNVSALAAKYGLAWGGDWRSYKDPMHFSVPYGGRE